MCVLYIGSMLFDTNLWYAVATVTLQTPTDISTSEGANGEMMTVDLCASLTSTTGPLRRNVVLNLTTVALTAGNAKSCNLSICCLAQSYAFTDFHN